MIAKKNYWRQRATETGCATTLQTEMEPYMALIVQRAAEGAPGTLADKMRHELFATTEQPTQQVSTLRLAAEMCDELLSLPGRIATRDTIVLTDTLAG